MAPQSFTGMVISSQNIGETDRRIVLLTREKARYLHLQEERLNPEILLYQLPSLLPLVSFLYIPEKVHIL